MRVLYIDVNCKGSSTGQIVYSLFSECKKNGIDATICYGRGPLIKEKGIYKFGIDIETMFHAIMTRLTGYTGCFSFFSTRRLIRYIKKYNPDIVHIHELHAYFVNIKPLLIYLRKRNIKTIFTNHCEFLYTGKCGYARECKKYSHECGNCPLLKDYPTSILFDCTKKMIVDKKKLLTGWNNTYYIAPSQWLCSRMDSSFLNNEKRYVINNGIDTALYKFLPNDVIKQKYNIPLDKKVVLSIAPDIFRIMKGGHQFLKLAKKMIDINYAVFVAVGASSIPSDIPTNVVVLPLIKSKEVLVGLYSISSCFLICSKYDNYPTTSLEAQCCGTKVVGFDVGGVKETILNSNGFVVPYNNMDEMREKILSILNSGYDKNEISLRSRCYFSRERMFNEYKEKYETLLNNNY